MRLYTAPKGPPADDFCKDITVARKVFYSFHYVPDSQRVAQVRSIGALEGNQLLSDNKWEEVTSAGEGAIKRWIGEQMAGRSCAVVLIGSATASRKWVKYEVEKAWNDGKGLVGIYIHNLKNLNGDQSNKGSNPFASLTVGTTNLSSIVKAYDPPYTTSTFVYSHIKENMVSWVEEAITIRNKY